MAATIPQMRIENEVDVLLAEAADEYALTKVGFIRHLLRFVLYTKFYRDIFGNKIAKELMRHDHHYQSLVKYVEQGNRTSSGDVRISKFADMIGEEYMVARTIYLHYLKNMK